MSALPQVRRSPQLVFDTRSWLQGHFPPTANAASPEAHDNQNRRDAGQHFAPVPEVRPADRKDVPAAQAERANPPRHRRRQQKLPHGIFCEARAEPETTPARQPHGESQRFDE